jgi:septum formation protein
MKLPLPVVLASASPARKSLLVQAGVEPIIFVSAIDEDSIAQELKDSEPAKIVEALAQAKAQAVMGAHTLPEAGILIAADSMWEFNNELVGKPKNSAQARERISAMSASSGILHTGHFVMNLASKQTAIETVSTIVTLDEISPSEIEAYLKTGEPTAVAGAFTINGYGAAFIKSVTGDANNVVGLSLNTVKRLSKQVGLDWTKTWTLQN